MPMLIQSEQHDDFMVSLAKKTPLLTGLTKPSTISSYATESDEDLSTLIKTEQQDGLMAYLSKRAALLTGVKKPSTISSYATESHEDLNRFHSINSDNLKPQSTLLFQNTSTSDFDLVSNSTCVPSIHSTKSQTRLSFGKEEEGIYEIKTLSRPNSITELKSKNIFDQTTATENQYRRLAPQGNGCTTQRPALVRDQQKKHQTAQRALEMAMALSRQETQMLYFCAATLMVIVAILTTSAYVFISTECPRGGNPQRDQGQVPQMHTCDNRSVYFNNSLPERKEKAYGHFQLRHDRSKTAVGDLRFTTEENLKIESSEQVYPPDLSWNNSVNFSGDKIIILNRGRYFVYSQVVFVRENSRKDEVPALKIVRGDNGQTLLETHVKYQSTLQQSFVSGFLSLERNDTLRVRVIGRIQESRQSSFVGVFML